MDQAGAGFIKPGQQERLIFPVKAGQDDYIKDICSPEGLILILPDLVRLVRLAASFQSKGEGNFDF